MTFGKQKIFATKLVTEIQDLRKNTIHKIRPKLKTFLSIMKKFFNGKKLPIYICVLLIINLLPSFKKKRMFLTNFLQNNTRRLQAVVSVLREYHA